MENMTRSGSEGVQATFCVAAGEEVVRAVANCTAQVPGFFFAGAFGDYITAEKRPHFPATMKAASGCVAFIDFDTAPELALKTAERLRQIFLKRIHMVAVGTNLDANTLLRAIRIGCVEYLSKPISVSETIASLERFHESLTLDAPAKNSTGRVMAFFGAKGGVGATTLAVHLAEHLVMAHNRKTLIIDHKHQLGHVALYLGLKDTQYHFDELLHNVDRLDGDLLRGFVVRHKTGLDVLASPDVANETIEATQDQLDRAMDFLRREYDYILIDSSITYQNTKNSIIEQADDVYLVSTADVASLRDLVRLVEHISQSPHADGKLKIVMNRSTSNESITPEQIRKIVRFPVTHTVPNNFLELLKSINQGEPIPPGNKTPFDVALQKWTDEIVGAKVEEAVTSTVVAAPRRMPKFPFWRQPKLA